MARVSQKDTFTFNFTDFDEPPKPLTGARYKVLDLPPSMPRPQGMAISEYVMTFPQRRLEHYRGMVRLLLEKYRVKSYRGTEKSRQTWWRTSVWRCCRISCLRYSRQM